MAALLLAACGTAAPPPTPVKEAAVAPKAAPAAPAKGAAAAPAKAPLPAAVKAAAAKPAATAPLDLKSLEQRLKETSAIGVLTKLSLKNQVDDLVQGFRAFHEKKQPTLGELRSSFDLLMMKVLSLLQDHDQALAKDISASRDAIWGVLTDRQKLSTYQ
ncbi:MAG TPA: hypothetical protein VM122_09030 [Usitatibacter sp.]|nr:hypothetical protein [Usitatibacter sp.]